VKDSSRETQVFYEAPHRLGWKTLADVVESFWENDRPTWWVAREVTKIHEEFLRGRVEEDSKKAQGPRRRQRAKIPLC